MLLDLSRHRVGVGNVAALFTDRPSSTSWSRGIWGLRTEKTETKSSVLSPHRLCRHPRRAYSGMTVSNTFLLISTAYFLAGPATAVS